MSDEPFPFRTEGRDVLITGYPSLLPRLLVELILECEPDSRVRLLVPPDDEARARRHLDDLEANECRVDLLIGRVTALDLGLDGTEYLDLIAEVTDIYHMAGGWRLEAEPDQLEELHVRGTRHVIDTASEMRSLERLHHLSTALVAGDRTGVVLEDELDEDQGFHNAHESTAFEAECLLEQSADHLPVSIYRPAIMVGDSRTGVMDRGTGAYHLMRAIVEAPESVPLIMPGQGRAPLHLVPADYVRDVIYALSTQPETEGDVFHIRDDNPLSSKRVFELIAECAGHETRANQIPFPIAKWLAKFPVLRKLTRNPRHILEYLDQFVLYNARHTDEALEGAPTCPPFGSYVDKLVDFIESTEPDSEMNSVGETVPSSA